MTVAMGVVGLGLVVIAAMAIEAVLASVERMRQDRAAQEAYCEARQAESPRFQRR